MSHFEQKKGRVFKPYTNKQKKENGQMSLTQFFGGSPPTDTSDQIKPAKTSEFVDGKSWLKKGNLVCSKLYIKNSWLVYYNFVLENHNEQVKETENDLVDAQTWLISHQNRNGLCFLCKAEESVKNGLCNLCLSNDEIEFENANEYYRWIVAMGWDIYPDHLGIREKIRDIQTKQKLNSLINESKEE